MRFSVALLACGLTVACKSASKEEAVLPHPRVRGVTAHLAPAGVSLPVSGVLASPPGRELKLGPLVPGRLAKLSVSEGALVRATQTLAEVESAPVAAELTQAEATAREAAAATQAAKAKRERTEVLVQRGVAARQELEQDRSAEVAAVAAEQRAKSAVDLAHRGVRRSVIQAPFDGVVTAVFVQQGESVDTSGQPIIQVSATDPLELRAFVPQAEVARVRAGQKVTLGLDARADPPPGEVLAVSPTIDARSGNVLVRIRVANPTGALRLGSLVRARILLEEVGRALRLPASVLLPTADGGVGVALVEEGRVRGVGVTVLSEENGEALLDGPVPDGAVVIVEGGYSLPDGTEVEVVR
ncbi:efflux RND transporter periplasmic adaptor subunit [Myxococcaceae bacterium JPH2]|nr:efflux RND transporter periplasmic adaptor subunit [Myxococcaceae bacterium JPH2]